MNEGPFTTIAIQKRSGRFPPPGFRSSFSLRPDQVDPITKMAERAVTSGQQNDLHSRCRIGQDLGHQIQAGIIGIDQRVVENQRHRYTLLE